MITFKRMLATARVFSQLQASNIMTLNKASARLLTYRSVYNFAFMSLFQNNKAPGQLDPAFKRKTKLKGHLKHKKNSGVVSPKKNEKIREQKTKLKNHKGLLKRIKIVGPRWDRQFKFRSPHRYHLRRNKSRSNLRRKLRARYVHSADIKRVKKLIPYFKRKSLKQRY